MTDYRGLGRLPKKPDDRNLQAAKYLLVAEPPTQYHFDKGRRRFPLLDQNGYPACTVFSAATAQLRFERLEQTRTPTFARAELVAKYERIAQPGGGAYMLDLLKQWRTLGYVGEVGWFPWLRRKYRYKIDGFVEVAINDPEMKRSMVAMRVLDLGVMVTETMYKQRTGLIQTSDADRLLGGHAICAIGYDECGVWIADTWAGFGPRQLSWPYITAYCDEAYGVIDARDTMLQLALNLGDFQQDLQVATQ
jgi:hypothetical protein